MKKITPLVFILLTSFFITACDQQTFTKNTSIFNDNVNRIEKEVPEGNTVKKILEFRTTSTKNTSPINNKERFIELGDYKKMFLSIDKNYSDGSGGDEGIIRSVVFSPDQKYFALILPVFYQPDQKNYGYLLIGENKVGSFEHLILKEKIALSFITIDSPGITSSIHWLNNNIVKLDADIHRPEYLIFNLSKSEILVRSNMAIPMYAPLVTWKNSLRKKEPNYEKYFGNLEVSVDSEGRLLSGKNILIDQIGESYEIYPTSEKNRFIIEVVNKDTTSVYEITIGKKMKELMNTENITSALNSNTNKEDKDIQKNRKIHTSYDKYSFEYDPTTVYGIIESKGKDELNMSIRYDGDIITKIQILSPDTCRKQVSILVTDSPLKDEINTIRMGIKGNKEEEILIDGIKAIKKTGYLTKDDPLCKLERTAIVFAHNSHTFIITAPMNSIDLLDSIVKTFSLKKNNLPDISCFQYIDKNILDIESFQEINSCYGKDKDTIFIRSYCKQDCSYYEISKADIKSFSSIQHPYSKDKNHVFYRTDPIEGADPISFEIIQDKHNSNLAYTRDKNNIFWQTKKIDMVDRETFEIITSQLVVGSYAKDKNHVYKENTIIEKADPKTFVLSDKDPDYQEDKTYIYKNGIIVNTITH